AKAVFSGSGNSADMPTTTLGEEDLTNGEIGVLTLMVKTGLATSNGDARRTVTQGGLSVNDQKVTDPSALIKIDGDVILKKGKKTFHKVVKG
ncbi:MAG: tyrosine--tRNA ligase, partial [Oscillospiraceae bacterium]|nr:tyrosine--tRNA ligase [Oscillospiraceae bacterium]